MKCRSGISRKAKSTEAAPGKANRSRRAQGGNTCEFTEFLKVPKAPGSGILFVEKQLMETLDIPDSKDQKIERAHRALAPQPPIRAQPRSILVQFLIFKMKEKVLNMA